MATNRVFKYYYILWSDAINFTRSSIRYIGFWKFHTLGFISFIMAMNLAAITLVLKIKVSFISISYIPTDVSNLIDFLIVFYLPPLLLNYVLIFSRRQWEKIRKDYVHYNGMVYKMYFVITLIVPASVLCIMKLWHEMNS